MSEFPKTMQEYQNELSEAFPPEAESTLNKGGARLTYIPQAEVLNRLNNVIGVANWSSDINYIGRDALDTDWVICLATLTVTFHTPEGSFTVHRQAPGGQKVKALKAGGPVDLGDEFKGAMSDALKKAATQLGVALYLARDDEAMAREVEDNKPEPSSDWKNFVSVSSSLNAEQKKALNVFWLKYNNGAEMPKPKADSYKQADLEALAAEAVRLKMGGEFVAS